MGQFHVRKVALQVFVILVVAISLIGHSIMPANAILNRVFMPLINKLVQIGGELNSEILITEIMYNPAVQEPGGEWIELYNRSSKTIDLSEIKIGDSETRGDSEGMYRFPSASVIEPGQVIIVANRALIFIQKYGFRPDFELANSDPSVPDLAKYREWAGGVINLNNLGDEILLLDADDNLLDTVSWGDSIFAFNPPAPKVSDDHSLERRPGDSDQGQAEEWFDQPEPQPGSVYLTPATPDATITPTGTTTSCQSTTILISEVMYDPKDFPDPGGEWIELFNWGNSPVQLECLFIGDEETKGGGEGMYSFPQNAIILAGEVIVIAYRGNNFTSTYGFDPDYEIIESDPSIPNLIKNGDWGTGSINLRNSGDEVILMGIQEDSIDTVSWGSSTFAFKPSVPAVEPGRSIARRPADQDTDSAADWWEQIDPQPGNVHLDLPSPTPSPTNTPTSTKTATPIPHTSTNTPTSTATRTSTPSPQPTQDLVINEIHADPHSSLGDANYDGLINPDGDEFVEIVNGSSTSIDLSGWAFGDYLAIRHTFPSGTVIAPNCGIVLFGGGTPNGLFGNNLVQVSSSGMLGLNDHADIVYLYDDSMSIVKTISYGEEAGDDQSITREPDITGGQPFVKHSLATGSGGSLFSPGTKIDGSYFSGCIK
jgi:hypothetical protein